MSGPLPASPALGGEPARWRRLAPVVAAYHVGGGRDGRRTGVHHPAVGRRVEDEVATTGHSLGFGPRVPATGAARRREPNIFLGFAGSLHRQTPTSAYTAWTLSLHYHATKILGEHGGEGLA